MSNYTVIATLNAVRVLLRDDGKYGVEDVNANEIAWRFRSEAGAMSTAQAMSDENDRIDGYESSKS